MLTSLLYKFLSKVIVRKSGVNDISNKTYFLPISSSNNGNNIKDPFHLQPLFYGFDQIGIAYLNFSSLTSNLKKKH